MKVVFATLAVGVASDTCGTWCEDNGHKADICDCGICGSFGACSFSCTEGGGRVACPQGPEPSPTPTPPAPTPTPPPAPSPPAPSPTPSGPIEKKEVTVGGFKCDTIQTATVYWPSDSSKKYPLLSFAHGWTEGGVNVAINYKDVIEATVAAGYVVIAEHSGLERLCYADEKHDQLHALDFIKDTPEFADRVDWDAKVGVFGHSMGGASSGLNAADADAVKKYNLGAAVCLHPAQGGQLAESLLPTFFATGTADTICPPAGVELMYNRAKGPKIFASMKGATHFECQTLEAGLPNPHGWDAYVQRWFNCHIKGMEGECDAAFDICDHSDQPKQLQNATW